MEFNFKGLMAPVFTSYNYDKEKSLNLDIVPTYAKYLKQKGVNGVLVNGTSGEGMSMNVAERKATAESWLRAVDTDQHVMIQVGGAPLPDVLELAKHAEKHGANSILCLPDLYFKPANAEQLINYLNLVSNAAPKTPLLYYHIPMLTNVNIHMGNFLKEITERVQTFCGIKFTSTALDEGIEAVNANEKFTVFLGADTLLLSAFVAGFDSAIATTLNIVPEISISILKNCNDNKHKQAKHNQEKLSKFTATVTTYGSWVSSMKAAMKLLTPIDCGPVRDPLIALTNNEAANMKAALD